LNKIQKTAINLLLSYILDNPMEKLPKMFEMAEKLDRGNLHATQIRVLRDVLMDKNSVWHSFVKNLFRDVDANFYRSS